MTQKNRHKKIRVGRTGRGKQRGRSQEAETSLRWGSRKKAASAGWEGGDKGGGDRCGTRVRRDLEAGTAKLSDPVREDLRQFLKNHHESKKPRDEQTIKLSNKNAIASSVMLRYPGTWGKGKIRTADPVLIRSFEMLCIMAFCRSLSWVSSL